MDGAIQLLADGLVIPIVLIAVYALLRYVPKGERLRTYSYVVMAGLTAYLLAKLIGFVYQPAAQRPFELLGLEPGALYLNNPGFPSDHALFVAAIALAVWFATRKKGLSIALAVGVVLVCIARVLALVHTPLDVIGGVAIALVGGLWYIIGYNAVYKSRRSHHGKRNSS